jgi:aspartyl protease family protein
VRAIAPGALLVAALVALWLTPPQRPLLGLSHDEFGRGALGLSILTWLLMSGMARAGRTGAARVFSAVALWALIGVALVAGYAYRFEFAEIADRVLAELNPSQARVGPGGEVVVRKRYGGEFLVPARINGRLVELVFDTGASAVVLTAEDAGAAGLSFSPGDFVVGVATANGAATAAPARLDSVVVGDIALHGVRALVARPGAMRQSLLGLSFLERLKSFGVENGRLVLKGK